jgi:hypothetical protein
MESKKSYVTSTSRRMLADGCVALATPSPGMEVFHARIPKHG